MNNTACPHCGQSNEIPAHYINKEVKCPSCRESYLATSKSEPAKTPEQRYKEELSDALARNWIMISEGPSGAQMELPKTMKTQTKVALILGFVLLIAWGFGIILIAAALIDYAMQKKQTKFIARH